MLSKSEAGKLGAKERMRLYGNFGTPEGRTLGGLRSMETHRKNQTAFQTLKKIKTPKDSELLAELLGILFGDGHLSAYQVSVTTNSETDIDHARFVKDLLIKLFGSKVAMRFKKDCKGVEIVLSSKSAVNFLFSKGMPIGNKMKNNLRAPQWILENPKFQKAFIKGLFDTDGSIYLDKKKIKGKEYSYMGWTITTYADRFMNDVVNILNGFGLKPTNRLTQKSVYIRRTNKIIEYFDRIGTSNPKHSKRYLEFSGRVPKRS